MAVEDAGRRSCSRQHGKEQEVTTIEEPGAAPEPKQLRRSRSDRWIAGVCGGLAEYFGLSAAIYRVLFVALALAGGTGIVLYVAAALVMPAEDREESILAEVLRRHRDRPWLVIGMALLALLVAFVLSEDGFWPGAASFWLVMALVIAIAVWAARGGRGRVVAVIAALVVLLAAAVGGAIAVAESNGGFGDVVERPLAASELDREYELGAGALVLDLRELELPPGETRLEARVGFGELEVIVPDDVSVSAVGKADWGDVAVFGLGADGRDVRQAAADPGFGDADTRLVVDARVWGGEVNIHR
jgi:phage shock protein PspC (stress-responsive transcriptional regulator)